MLAIATLISFATYAEDKISDYSMSYFGEKTYDIEVSAVKNGNFTFYIYSEPKGNTEKIGFILKSKKVEEFCNQLNAIKPKFEEWSNLNI